MSVGDGYDVAIIGAGSAGLSAASVARRLGVRVALVEQAHVRGDCTWTGCVPSKTLLHVAQTAHRMRRAGELGLRPGDPGTDLAAVMAHVRDVVERVYAHETPDALARQGVEVLTGPARFLDRRTLDVGGRRVRARRYILCAGARPAIPPIPGLRDIPRLTYEDVWELRELPARLLILGGGPIAAEMSQAFARLGSRVTVLARGDRLLSVADPEASAALEEALREEGVELRLGAPVERVEEIEGGVRAWAGGRPCEGGRLLVALGRRPTVEGLDLERAGVEYTEQGVTVDERLRTSNRRVYAAGDVLGGPQFTHYAGLQGSLAARNALLPGGERGLRPSVPWIFFTDPQVCQVGQSEAEARERGEPLVVLWPTERIDRAQTVGERRGFLKLIARRDGTLLGATVVAGDGEGLANELALAIGRGVKLGDLARVMHVYPTYGVGLQQAGAEDAITRALRGWRGPLLRALARWAP